MRQLHVPGFGNLSQVLDIHKVLRSIVIRRQQLERDQVARSSDSHAKSGKDVQLFGRSNDFLLYPRGREEQIENDTLRLLSRVQ